MTSPEPATPATRIDQLRTAIDRAVSDLNEAWSGFGPSEALEAVISDLQRARTNDDIAQGRDWPPVVLGEATDRAAPADRIDVETLAAALHEAWIGCNQLDLGPSDHRNDARKIVAEYDRLRGSR